MSSCQLRLLLPVSRFAAVMLNDTHIFDLIFSDSYVMDVVGALECE